MAKMINDIYFYSFFLHSTHCGELSLPWRRWRCRQWPWLSSGGAHCPGYPTVGDLGDTDTGADSDGGDDAEEDQEAPAAQGPCPLRSPQLLPSLPYLPPGKQFWRISWETSWVSLSHGHCHIIPSHDLRMSLSSCQGMFLRYDGHTVTRSQVLSESALGSSLRKNVGLVQGQTLKHYTVLTTVQDTLLPTHTISFWHSLRDESHMNRCKQLNVMTTWNTKQPRDIYVKLVWGGLGGCGTKSASAQWSL